MTAKPKIYTASWFTKLPETHAPIGISRGTPRGRSGYRRYRQLEPGTWFSSVSVEEYSQRYRDEVLGVLDPQRVLNELEELAAGRIPTLLCWEPQQPGDKWCHRALVSVWFWEKLNLKVFELGHEHEGCGHAHPKLYPSHRKGAQPKS